MRVSAAVLALAAGLALAQTAQAAIVFQDNFDSEPAGSVLNYNSFANWDVVNGTVDKIASGDFGITCAGGAGICVDLDGSFFNAGDLVTKAAFSIAAGDTVTLKFDFSGNQRLRFFPFAPDAMTVSLGSLFSEVFANIPSNQPFQTITRTFVAGVSENAKLTFSHAGFDNFGIILDNVQLEVEPIPVPAPLLLMGSVLGLAAWKARRRRA